MVETAGIEAQEAANKELATNGHETEDRGQGLSNTGQALGLSFCPLCRQRTLPGNLRLIAGQDPAPKWPQREPLAFRVVCRVERTVKRSQGGDRGDGLAMPPCERQMGDRLAYGHSIADDHHGF